MAPGVRVRIERGTIAAFFAASGALAALACAGPNPGDGSAVLPEDACALGGAECAGAGSRCASSAECASGSCVAGRCGAPVLGSGGSGSSQHQSGVGGLLLTDDYPSESGGAPSVCADLDVEFERATPTVVLLIDRSGSMTESFEGSRNRWQTLVQTLTDPDTSLIERLQGSVRFGMALYTSNGGFGDGSRQCPILTSVDIALENFSNISRVLSRASNGPSGDTPTAESLAAVAADLSAFGEEGPKSIILATDGEPDTCEDPDANDDDGSRAKSVAAVAAARAAGITTHVISVGDEISAAHLKALAVAGAGGDEDAEAYTALDTAALEGAFEAIIGNVQSCDFTLQGSVEAADAPRGSVSLDGERLAYGDADGWVMLNESTVQLRGAACEAVKSSAARVAMSFPCDAIQIRPQ